MHRVLITARMFGYLSDRAFDIFKKRGFEVVPNPYRGKGLSEKELIELIGGVDGLLTGVDQVTRRFIEATDKLTVISKFGAGVDNIDVDAATEKGIVVTNAPGMNSEAVADMTFALMLAAARKVTFAFDRVRSGEWPLIVGSEVWGKTLGIIGLGQIGRRMAIRAAGFNMNVLVHEKFPDEQFIREQNLKLTGLDQLLQESDFISIHVPLTHETRNLIGQEQFEMMKPTAFLINTARGAVIDENALYRALRSGKIAGAALDVLIEEPPKDRRLMELENVIITPHISPFTKEALENTEKLSAQNIIDVLEGNPPPYVINKEVLKRRDKA